MGIFLADEGLDVGVVDLGVVAVDLEAPAAGQRFLTVGERHARSRVVTWGQRRAYLQWESWRRGGTSLAG